MDTEYQMQKSLLALMEEGWSLRRRECLLMALTYVPTVLLLLHHTVASASASPSLLGELLLPVVWILLLRLGDLPIIFAVLQREDESPVTLRAALFAGIRRFPSAIWANVRVFLAVLLAGLVWLWFGYSVYSAYLDLVSGTGALGATWLATVLRFVGIGGLGLVSLLLLPFVVSRLLMTVLCQVVAMAAPELGSAALLMRVRTLLTDQLLPAGMLLLLASVIEALLSYTSWLMFAPIPFIGIATVAVVESFARTLFWTTTVALYRELMRRQPPQPTQTDASAEPSAEVGSMLEQPAARSAETGRAVVGNPDDDQMQKRSGPGCMSTTFSVLAGCFVLHFLLTGLQSQPSDVSSNATYLGLGLVVGLILILTGVGRRR